MCNGYGRSLAKSSVPSIPFQTECLTRGASSDYVAHEVESTHIVCVAMTSLRIMLNCGVAEPSSAFAAVPKVLARRYRGTIRCRRFAQYPSPSSVCGKEGRSEALVASKRII